MSTETDRVSVHPAHLDRVARWQPTAFQKRTAESIMTWDARIDAVVVGLALPGKDEGVWDLGQPVEKVAGFWPARFDRERPHPESYAVARDEADRAAGRHLRGRKGTSSYVVIRRDGSTPAFEGMYGNRTDTPA